MSCSILHTTGWLYPKGYEEKPDYIGFPVVKKSASSARMDRTWEGLQRLKKGKLSLRSSRYFTGAKSFKTRKK